MPVIEEFQPGSLVVMVINNTGLELALDINTCGEYGHYCEKNI